MTEKAPANTVNDPPLNLEQEVDLLEYLNAILRAKYRIAFVALLVAGGVFAYSKILEERFTAIALVAINIQEETGGLKAGDYRGSDLLALMEHDLVVQNAADNERERLIARMSSTNFIDYFVKENNLLPVIFHKQWNELDGTWLDGRAPTLAETVKIFREKVVAVELDQKTGMLFIKASSFDPEIAADIANKYYAAFNKYTLERKMDELADREKILEDRLASATSLEIKRSIFRMQEMQLAEETFLLAKRDYPLEVIELAQVPLFKAYPKRKSWTVIALVLTLFLGIVVVLAAVVLRKLVAALKIYSDEALEHKAVPVASEKSRLGRKSQLRSKHDKPDVPGAPKSNTGSSGANATGGLDELSEWLDKP